MISVAIVEDNADLRKSLTHLLEESPGFRCVGSYETAEAALRQLPKQPAEVVLMDINLPTMSGIECTRQLRELLPQTRVIIITVYRDHDKIFKALRSGASGYLLKRSSPDDILGAITEVHQGGAPMSSEVARKVVEAFQAPPAKEDQLVDLSPREREVLDLLAEGLPDKEIAGKLCLSLPTIRYHLRHIYDKLHVRSRTEAALKHHAAKPSGPDHRPPISRT
jgi:DNA-binding NarL/FixJ family response regulator